MIHSIHRAELLVPISSNEGMSAFGGKADMRFLRCKCLLLTVDSTGQRNTPSHSICWGLNPKVLRALPAMPKVPGFSAAVKPRKNPRRFVTYFVFPLQDRECCVDRLNRPPKADIPRCHNFEIRTSFASLKQLCELMLAWLVHGLPHRVIVSSAEELRGHLSARRGGKMRDIIMLVLTAICLGGDLFALELLEYLAE